MLKIDKVKDRNVDYKWFCRLSRSTLNKYSGKWIAIKNKKILSSGYDGKKVIEEAEKNVKEPILVKIPDEGEILIL